MFEVVCRQSSYFLQQLSLYYMEVLLFHYLRLCSEYFPYMCILHHEKYAERIVIIKNSYFRVQIICFRATRRISVKGAYFCLCEIVH